MAALLIVGMLGCKGNFEKIQKSKDVNFKLAKANEYYEKKQWSKANTLYEECLTIFKGTKSFEDIYYNYAYTFYNMKSYLPASYHFKNFADIFPKSARAEECEYMNSLCLYYQSPEASLDQTNTIKSMSELQTFVNTHSESKRVDEANKLIDQSREKLEEKDNYSAQLYYKIGQEKAASIAFQQLLNKYPDSKLADYYNYMQIKSYAEYAKQSIEEKQRDRYQKVVDDITDFKQKYPKSKYLSSIDQINAVSLQSLKK
jgi:outer membrane protein assembly factor BamD